MAGKRWTEAEIEFLKENYAEWGIRACVEALGRSWPSVTWKAQTLGIKISSELHGDRIRQIKLGKPRPESVRRKMSESMQGRPAPNKIPRDKLIQELLDLAYVLDRSPQRNEMEELSKFSYAPFAREFGSWTQALKVAGLPPSPPKPRLDRILPCHCEACGKLIEEPKWANRRFCDLHCFGIWLSLHNAGENNPRWRGGKAPYYGKNWRKQRWRARKRDNYTCQECGITEQELDRQLDVHHIVPFREYGLERYKEANRLSNLITLCSKHHRESEDTLLNTTQ